MSAEVWTCLDCNREVQLSKQGRCEVCQSEAVFPHTEGYWAKVELEKLTGLSPLDRSDA